MLYQLSYDHHKEVFLYDWAAKEATAKTVKRTDLGWTEDQLLGFREFFALPKFTELQKHGIGSSNGDDKTWYSVQKTKLNKVGFKKFRDRLEN